jgi:hypothetical protein
LRNLFLIFLATLSLSAGIGKISAMRGDVTIIRNGETIVATKGQEIEEKDTIKTTKKSKAQLRFKDKTVVRVGRNAVFEIEEYLFDKTNKSKAKFKAKNGFFSAVTGGIGKVAKDRFKLKTKTSTIGIRGTHFQGTVDDAKGEEEIACLSGAITLEIAGELVDVEAGEVLSIKDGLSSPVRKINSKDIKKMETKSISKTSDLSVVRLLQIQERVNDLQEKADQLAEVADSDQKIEEYVEITDEFNEIYEEVSESMYVSNLILDSSKDGQVAMNLYTQDEIELPENYVVSENLDTIQAGTPYNVKIERTEESTVEQIANYVPSYKHWDGNNEAGKVARYSGEMIFAGKVAYDPSIETINDLERETILAEEVLAENGVDKKITFEADYLNGYVGGNFEYRDGQIFFSNSGTGALGSETFLYYGNNILSNNPELFGEEVQEIFIGAQNSGYSGENLETLSAEIAICLSDFITCKNLDGSNSLFVTIRGGFIAEKDSETELYKKDIDSDEQFSWGYWAYQFEGEDEKLRGAWFTTDMERTARENIPQMVTASYSGDIYGTVENALEGTGASEIENGNFKFDFDFTAKTMNGDISFNANNENYAVQFKTTDQFTYETGAEHDFEFKKSFSTSIINVINESGPRFEMEGGIEPTYMQGQGNFYGENGENIAGGFTAGFNNGDTAIATFKGAKE